MANLSIVTSHFNRKKILYKSLEAYSLSANISECEFIIVDDCSDKENCIDDIKETFPLLNTKLIKIDQEDKTWILPTVPFNIGLKLATSEKTLMINPESFPMGDIIADAIENLKENEYRVYGCYSVSKANTYRILRKEISKESIEDIRSILPLKTDIYLLFDGQNAWYQHSVYRPKKYCFCLAIFKRDFERIGYLNDNLANGKGFGDDDLVLAAIQNNMQIVQIDNPFVLHLNHYNDYDAYLGEQIAKHNAEIFGKRQSGIITTTNKYQNIYKKYVWDRVGI